jgi:hypothetical protein
MEKKSTIVYRAHLFSDVFVISRKLSALKGKYKYHRAVDLASASIARAQSVDMQHAFAVTTPSMRTPYIFRCRDDTELVEWMADLQRYIDIQSAATEQNRLAVDNSAAASAAGTSTDTKRSSMLMKSNSSVSSAAVLAVQGLVARVNALESSMPSDRSSLAAEMCEFLQQESDVARLLLTFNEVAIQPLIDATRGAELVVGSASAAASQDSARASSAIASGTGGAQLQERKGSYIAVIGGLSARMHNAQVQEALRDSDMQIFLRVAETIGAAHVELMASIEQTLRECQFKDSQLRLGSLFSSQQAENLYQQCVSYASGFQAALRVLSLSTFSQWREKVEEALSPFTFENTVQAGLRIPNRLSYFLTAMQKKVSVGQRDIAATLEQGVSRLHELLVDISSVTQLKKNFEKVLSVYESFFKGPLFQDKVMLNLVTTERTFLREGDLTKVCRKENKVFHFWLFNDYLIYGTTLPNGTYKWNRAIPLVTCSTRKVTDNTSFLDKFAFELFGEEKSFVLLAGSAGELDLWAGSIMEAADAERRRLGVKAPDLSQVTHAAIWVPDSVGVNCCVCNQVSQHTCMHACMS